MDLVDILHVVKYWSENLCSTIMTHLRDLQVKVMDIEIFLLFQVKVFTSLYLLSFKMDLVGTLHVVRYWSENLCTSIMTNIRNLQVKVMDFEIFLMFQVKVFG